MRLQYLLITGVTCWAITPCSEENRVALKRNRQLSFFFLANAPLSRLVARENQEQRVQIKKGKGDLRTAVESVLLHELAAETSMIK